jgi:hypothetical protein
MHPYIDLQNLETRSDEDAFLEILENVLVPRGVDSEGGANVRKYISDFLSELGWTVEIDQFEQAPSSFSD